jgi:hypothetical protein
MQQSPTEANKPSNDQEIFLLKVSFSDNLPQFQTDL